MTHIKYIYENPLDRLKPEEPIRCELDRLYQEQELAAGRQRRVWKLTRAIKAAYQKLMAAEVFNERLRTKWTMLFDPARRDRVLSELGGEPALHRWEYLRDRIVRLRARRKERRITTRRKTPRRYGTVSPPGTYAVQTDSSGRFCLARAAGRRAMFFRGETRPYERQPKLFIEQRYERHLDRRKPLIPLTPDELRGDVLMGLGVRRDGTVSGTGELYDPGSGREEIINYEREAPPEADLSQQVKEIMFQALARAAEALVEGLIAKHQAITRPSKYAGIGTGPD